MSSQKDYESIRKVLKVSDHDYSCKCSRCSLARSEALARFEARSPKQTHKPKRDAQSDMHPEDY